MSVAAMPADLMRTPMTSPTALSGTAAAALAPRMQVTNVSDLAAMLNVPPPLSSTPWATPWWGPCTVPASAVDSPTGGNLAREPAWIVPPRWLITNSGGVNYLACSLRRGRLPTAAPRPRTPRCQHSVPRPPLDQLAGLCAAQRRCLVPPPAISAWANANSLELRCRPAHARRRSRAWPRCGGDSRASTHRRVGPTPRRSSRRGTPPSPCMRPAAARPTRPRALQPRRLSTLRLSAARFALGRTTGASSPQSSPS